MLNSCLNIQTKTQINIDSSICFNKIVINLKYLYSISLG